MLDVNFIVTNYNREDYWPYLKNILNSYKKIKAHIAYCYSGVKQDEVCDFRCINRGHIEGDTDLMIGGYNLLKNNGVKKWIKICVDSWLLDEDKILGIFDVMDKNDYVYSGNTWTSSPYFATDIFFSRDNEFKFMEKFTGGAIQYITEINYSIEGYIADLARESNRYYLIPEREPVQGDYGTRFVVESLGWVMHHNLGDNIKFMEEYKKKINS